MRNLWLDVTSFPTVFHVPQNWKVINSRSRRCMWIMTSICIQACTYFPMLNSRDGSLMWFLTTRGECCCGTWKWYFENEEWWCSFLREGFPRELSVLHFYIPIMNIGFHLCKRWTSPVPIWDGGDIIRWYLRLKACNYIINFGFFIVPK